jgi:vacuolar iron transporter family protein
MEKSLRTGFSFGLVSGIITTLGLMIGLNASTGSKIVVIGGILTIAIADSLSDSLGIHISEESKNNNKRYIWKATISTFFSKLFFALTFLIPVLLFSLNIAIVLSIIWGLFLISVFSYSIGEEGKKYKVVIEHLAIAIIVIILTDIVGKFISGVFV